MNHCIHGECLNCYCPACELDCRMIEEWLFPGGSARFTPDCNVRFDVITTLVLD